MILIKIIAAINVITQQSYNIYFRYFYRQLLLFYSKNPAMMEKSIFCTEPASNLLTLKQNINIYLYMNQLPKGSAQIKSQL